MLVLPMETFQTELTLTQEARQAADILWYKSIKESRAIVTEVVAELWTSKSCFPKVYISPDTFQEINKEFDRAVAQLAYAYAGWREVYYEYLLRWQIDHRGF